MFIKKSVIVIFAIFSFGVFAFSASAEETAASMEIVPESPPSPSIEEPAVLTPPAEPIPELMPLPAAEPAVLSVPAAVSEVAPSLPPSPAPPTIDPVGRQTPEASDGLAELNRTPNGIDPAIAPSKVTINVLMPAGVPPPFPVFVTFVGVGNKNFGGKINANGELTVTMPQGRYYAELLVISTEYVQGEDGPSFFLEANEERDLGAIKLMPKADQTSRVLEDIVLEADILREAESAKGVGGVLVLIVKLLIKILEEIRVIVQKI